VKDRERLKEGKGSKGDEHRRMGVKSTDLVLREMGVKGQQIEIA